MASVNARRLAPWMFVVGSAMVAGPAVGQVEDDGEPVAPSLPSGDDPEGDGDTTRSIEEELAEQRALLEELEARLRQQENEQAPPPRLRFFGYVDLGAFVPLGNEGVGWTRDAGFTQFPEYAGQYAWVFLGDIFATTVNTRGEVADLGDAPGAAQRFDSIDSDGAFGFLVNEVTVGTEIRLAESVLARTMINFVPRTGNDFALGDFFDVDIAEVEWVVTDDGNTSLWAGKTLPVFGIEYKERKSHQRFGITPSLVHRYTSGTQLGLKGRTRLFDGWLVLAGSVTNGSSTTEQFHFYNEIDKNNGKTLNGRLAIHAPLGDLIDAMPGHSLEIGLSGSWGPQDRATDDEGAMWFVGVDLQYRTTDFALKAQWMRGQAPGKADELVWGLDLGDSGYVEIDYMVLPYLGFLARAGLRDAIVTLANERLYLTKSMRFTGGIRAVVNSHMALKAEYLHNREFGGIMQFDNDVVTSSLVLSY